tara:strand:+ start:3595 stop:4347 length:753 start_codon:yes stop_codon:yes gene_type:complete
METGKSLTLDMVEESITKRARELFKEIKSLYVESQIATINQIKLDLHEISPMKKEPVDCVIWVKGETVIANDYNPNSVAPPEMKLLEISIKEDGFTQPVVTWQNENDREVVDGFHRNRVVKEVKSVGDRLMGYLPVVTINDARLDKGDRIAATIRHNRARGKHRIDAMSDIVVDLKRRNWSDDKIARDLGMDADEVLRLAQITGLAEMFSNREFSEAWEAASIDPDDSLAINEENSDTISEQDQLPGLTT